MQKEIKIKGGLRMTEAGLTLGVGIPGTAQFFDILERIFVEPSGGLKPTINIGKKKYLKDCLSIIDNCTIKE